MCTCRPSALLFTADGAAGGHDRSVPERYLSDRGFKISPGQWEALQVPVAIAFFFHNSRWAAVRVLSRARPAPPNRCCPSGLAEGRGRPIPWSPPRARRRGPFLRPYRAGD